MRNVLRNHVSEYSSIGVQLEMGRTRIRIISPGKCKYCKEDNVYNKTSFCSTQCKRSHFKNVSQEQKFKEEVIKERGIKNLFRKAQKFCQESA